MTMLTTRLLGQSIIAALLMLITMPALFHMYVKASENSTDRVLKDVHRFMGKVGR